MSKRIEEINFQTLESEYDSYTSIVENISVALDRYRDECERQGLEPVWNTVQLNTSWESMEDQTFASRTVSIRRYQTVYLTGYGFWEDGA